MGWVQPRGCQFATSAEIQTDGGIYGSVAHQPRYPIDRRNELRCGLAYQCFRRKDRPLNCEFHSVTSRAGGPATERAQPACHSLSIPSYLVCAKAGGSPLGVARDQSLKPRCSRPVPSWPRPHAAPPRRVDLHLCPPHQPLGLPGNLLTPRIPPFPLQPCQRRCSPPAPPPQQCQC